MPWWLTTIFPALLICFMIGALLGSLLMWRRLRDLQNEFDRRRLEGEAESDRLRLRISALRARDDLATKLEAEVAERRVQTDRLATLQGQLQEAETKAHLVPALERQLTETRERALMADRYEEEIVVLRSRIATHEKEAMAALPAGRPHESESRAVAALERAGVEAENETLTAELRSTRIELEESRSRTGQLDAELQSALEDRDRLRSEVMVSDRTERDREALVTELENEVTSLRSAVEASEAQRAEALNLRQTMRLRSAPDAAPTGVNGPRPASLATAASATVTRPAVPLAAAEPMTTWADNGSWKQGHTTLGTPGADHDDDLKAIKGIGPVMERTLNGFGIRTWEQIAVLTSEDIEKVSSAIGSFPGRIERDDWIGGARKLLAAGHGPDDTSPDALADDSMADEAVIDRQQPT